MGKSTAVAAEKACISPCSPAHPARSTDGMDHGVRQTLKATCPITFFDGCGHQGQGKGGTLLCLSLDSNTDCQLDKICGHLADKALGTPVRQFLVKGRKTYLVCGYHHLMGWCTRMTGYNMTSCLHCHHHDFLPWWAASLNGELN